MFRSDRGDTEELYRNGTFKGINIASFTIIDEIDFPNIHDEVSFYFKIAQSNYGYAKTETRLI